MSLNRSRIGSWMPRATSSSISSFMSIAPGVPSWTTLGGVALASPFCRGVTIRLPCSLTPK